MMSKKEYYYVQYPSYCWILYNVSLYYISRNGWEDYTETVAFSAVVDFEFASWTIDIWTSEKPNWSIQFFINFLILVPGYVFCGTKINKFTKSWID